MELSKLSTGLHHIGIPTKDMAATEAFYKKLGGDLYFTKEYPYTDSEGNTAMMRSSLIGLYNTIFEIYSLGTGAPDGNIDHIAFRVDDIGAVVSAFEEAGIEIIDHSVSVGWPSGRGEYAMIRGVNGERIEFIQDTWA